MAYTALPALLASLPKPQRQYQAGDMFAGRRIREQNEEAERSARERERLTEQGQLLDADQAAATLRLHRRGQDLEMGRFFAERQSAREAAAKKEWDDAQAAFQAADVQGDEAGREAAAAKLRALGAQVERVEPYQAPVPLETTNPDAPEAEELRRKISRAAVERKLTPQARQQLASAEDVVLTPSEGAAAPAMRPGLWRVRRDGKTAYQSRDESTAGWRQQAVERAFAQYAQNPSQPHAAAAQRAKEFAMGELGTKPLPEAIDAGMAVYLAETKRIDDLERTRIGAGRPRSAGSPGAREKTAWGQIQQLYTRTNTQHKFAEAQSTEADLMQSLSIIKNRSALGDTAAATQLAKSLQSGVLSNQDINMIMDPSFSIKINNMVGRYFRGGLRDDEFMRQVEEMVYSGLERTNRIRTNAALEFRREMESPLLNLTPEERLHHQNRGFEWFAGVPFAEYERRQRGQRGGQRTAPAPQRGTPAPAPAKPQPKPAPKPRAPSPPKEKPVTPSAKPGNVERTLMKILE